MWAHMYNIGCVIVVGLILSSPCFCCCRFDIKGLSPDAPQDEAGILSSSNNCELTWDWLHIYTTCIRHWFHVKYCDRLPFSHAIIRYHFASVYYAYYYLTYLEETAKHNIIGSVWIESCCRCIIAMFISMTGTLNPLLGFTSRSFYSGLSSSVSRWKNNYLWN